MEQQEQKTNDKKKKDTHLPPKKNKNYRLST